MVSLLWYNHAFSHISDDLCLIPGTAPSNPRDSIKPRIRTTVIELQQTISVCEQSSSYSRLQTNIIGNDFFVFISFHCPQHFYCSLCHTAAPASLNMHVVSTNFAKTLVCKREYDVILWRHKQCISSNNGHHRPTPLLNTRIWQGGIQPSSRPGHH